jgi:hypothetical protein
MAKQKRNLYRKLKLDPSLKQKYKLLSQEYDKLVSNWHDKIESKVCENRNVSSFYKYANKKFKCNVVIPPLQTEDNRLITEDDNKVELFNKYFQSVFISDNNIPLNIPSRLPPENSYDGPTISTQAVLDVITKMPTKTSKTPEDIPAILVKKCREPLAKFLSLLFNLSINTNQIPWQWKFSLITPIHKKGSKNLTKNYRPIALTSVICRILEKLVSLSILGHLDSNKLLSPNQHGFLPRRSSSTQLLEAILNWFQSLDKNKTVTVVYTDLAKAFDKVSHSKLLQVLKSYGICGRTYNWLESYLTDRVQSVVLKNTRSQPLPVTSGVPQGSVIGPLLFLLYIDDISSVSSNNSTVCLFADDAKIYSSDATDLQISLDRISEFFRSRQLQLAPDKCELLVLGKTADSTSFHLEGTTIRHEDSVKDLGIWISHDLKWETHIKKIAKSAYQRANHILKAFRTTNVWTLMKAFKTYVRPMLEYGTTTWSPYLKQDKTTLDSVQRFFTRKVCQRCRIPYTSYEDRLLKLNTRSLEYRRLEFDLLFLYKMLNSLIDIKTTDFFSFFDIHYNMRSHTKRIRSKLPQKNEKQRNFFCNRCVPIWNSLPSEIVTSPTYSAFRVRLKRFDLNTIVNLLFK